MKIPFSRHIEQHFSGSELVRDLVIGMSDGLTVPFALAAGLSGAVSSSTVVLVAGVAEMAAGSIAMGLGGYMAAKSEEEHYQSELRREKLEIQTMPDHERQEVKDIFREYGLEGDTLEKATNAIIKKPDVWLNFMMRQELGLEQPNPKRALQSAFAIGGSYIVGGLIPLAPYAFGFDVQTALLVSVVITLVALAVFGAVKARFTGVPLARGAFQTTLVGGIAAGVAFLIARLVSGLSGGI
jgi:vacuolar iron transporter family protein